ncbi:MAG: site-specific integrase [Rhizobiales bacterium]|nr:site-specific integrase [Hyphomicrobiales bacterium]
MRVQLKGVHKVKSKGNIYYYAWRGGPRLAGNPGSQEFLKSYNNAISDLRSVDNKRFHFLIVEYKGSDDFKKLSESTRRNWGPWLDRIRQEFGDLRIAQFDRPEKIKPVIRRWRGQWSNTARTADYGLQVLSRVLSYAVDPLGAISVNPCEGIKYLYTNNRAETIWTDEQIARIKATTSKEVGWAVDLAAFTGLRRGDLLSLTWESVGENSIEHRTSKSNGRRPAIIPLYDDLRQILASIENRSPFVLTNTQGKPWSDSGFGSSFDSAKNAAKMKDIDLHFHDLRGTAATKFYNARIPIRVIAEIMAWDEGTVEKIIRRYVGRDAATKALIAQINLHTESPVKLL